MHHISAVGILQAGLVAKAIVNAPAFAHFGVQLVDQILRICQFRMEITTLIKTGLIVGLLIMVFCSLNNNLHLISEEILAESVLFTPLKNAAYTVFPYLKSLIFWN